MGSSEIITIFSEPHRARLYPSPFVVSVLLHASVFSLLTARMVEKNRIIESFPAERYSLRVLDFHSTEPQAGQAGGGAITYPGPRTPVRANLKQAALKPSKGGSSSGSLAMAHETAQRMPAPQTLIQPDLPRDVVLPPKMPVPLVVLWSPEKVVAKKVVPPLPDKASIAVVHPSLDIPIPEENLAEMRIASTALVTMTPAAPPSTTSPVVVHGPEELKKVPQTTSKSADPPAPARVVSLSDIRVADGKIAVPAANQTSPKLSAGAMVPGQLRAQPQAAVGVSANKSARADVGEGQGDRAGASKEIPANANKGSDPHGKATPTGNAAKGGDRPSAAGAEKSRPAATLMIASKVESGVSTYSTAGSASGARVGNGISTVHISLPKDGQFGVVVLGSSIADKYPETAELWSGRMAATVYLRVGLPKSWILQYTLPRLAEAAAAGGGRLEAPWPYEIMRPNLDPGDVDADAVILHGYVNQDGRFEKLEVVFPTPLVQAPTVLNVLNLWQFRPAKQNGLLTAVEVLLIIPDQSQ